jgi:hypothetical protein
MSVKRGGERKENFSLKKRRWRKPPSKLESLPRIKSQDGSALQTRA